MSLNSLIMNTLSPTNVPVDFLKYKGTATTYITFFEYNQQGVVFGDDEELNTRHSFQVDVWSKGNYIALVEQVKTLLKEIGFIRNSETEFYENDTEIYHKVLRFYYSN
ncbi:MAG: hypothetical protein R3328_00020 [Planococcaceae bacterium]|nr:hypothetical protein [Planococcaceae bacterium]